MLEEVTSRDLSREMCSTAPSMNRYAIHDGDTLRLEIEGWALRDGQYHIR